MARPCARRPLTSGPETSGARRGRGGRSVRHAGLPVATSRPGARPAVVCVSAVGRCGTPGRHYGRVLPGRGAAGRGRIGAWPGTVRSGPSVHGVKHGLVRRAGEIVDVPAGQVPGGERGQQVDGAPGGLDPCEVARRQCGCRMPGEPLPGEGQGSRPDEFRGRHAMPSGGLSDQGPLGVGEPDRARPARPAMRTPGRAPRGGILLLTAGQPCGSVVAAGGHARPDRAGPAARVSRFRCPPCPGSGAGSGRG